MNNSKPHCRIQEGWFHLKSAKLSQQAFSAGTWLSPGVGPENPSEYILLLFPKLQGPNPQTSTFNPGDRKTRQFKSTSDAPMSHHPLSLVTQGAWFLDVQPRGGTSENGKVGFSSCPGHVEVNWQSLVSHAVCRMYRRHGHPADSGLSPCMSTSTLGLVCPKSRPLSLI